MFIDSKPSRSFAKHLQQKWSFLKMHQLSRTYINLFIISACRTRSLSSVQLCSQIPSNTTKRIQPVEIFVQSKTSKLDSRNPQFFFNQKESPRPRRPELVLCEKNLTSFHEAVRARDLQIETGQSMLLFLAPCAAPGTLVILALDTSLFLANSQQNYENFSIKMGIYVYCTYSSDRSLVRLRHPPHKCFLIKIKRLYIYTYSGKKETGLNLTTLHIGTAYGS